MKKLLVFTLLVSANTYAQYPTINSTTLPGLGVGVPSGANFGDAAIHVNAADNTFYSNGGGQQIFFAETTAPAASGDHFRIMNSSGTNALFTPLLSGYGNSHNAPSLVLQALASSARDNGTNPLMTFRAGLNFTPISSQETPNAGNVVVNRPLFQWANWDSPKMTMLANGSLGLGTTTPTNAALHVMTGSTPGMLTPVIKLDRNDLTNQAGLLSIGISGNGFATGLLGGGSAYFKLEDPYGNSSNSDMGFSTNGAAAQFVIKHNGNIGIGTETPIAGLDVQNGIVRIGSVSTPLGYKLYVQEGILTEKVKVALASTASWADYVFAKDYQLKPLAEVEAFILENQHLPNVPSADDLVKEGLDLGKMQAIQMEKIEELTLYLIEMKKEIEALRKENNLLKSKN